MVCLWGGLRLKLSESVLQDHGSANHQMMMVVMMLLMVVVVVTVAMTVTMMMIVMLVMMMLLMMIMSRAKALARNLAFQAQCPEPKPFF